MRLIKVKAWDLVAGRMRQVAFIEFEETGEVVSVALRTIISVHEPHGIETRHLGDDVVLLESTGHYDKRGNEIYEGDVIRSEGNTYVVEFIVNTFRPEEIIERGDDYSVPFARALNDVEVMGNRYENPELLTNPFIKAARG